MASEKPTDETHVVPLDLSIERRLILRDEIETWRDGVWGDLRDPSKLRDPGRTRRFGEIYDRLVEAMRWGRIELPDEEARAALQEVADLFDEREEWEQTKAVHDAYRVLLAVLGGEGESAPSPPPTDSTNSRPARTTRDEDLAMESAVLQRVLDVQPARLTRSELLREIAGEEADFDTRDAVERATRDLGGVGLLHAGDEFLTPTRAALRFQELADRA